MEKMNKLSNKIKVLELPSLLNKNLWEYKAEGRANIVVAYCGTEAKYNGVVLRVKKRLYQAKPSVHTLNDNKNGNNNNNNNNNKINTNKSTTLNTLSDTPKTLNDISKYEQNNEMVINKEEQKRQIDVKDKIQIFNLLYSNFILNNFLGKRYAGVNALLRLHPTFLESLNEHIYLQRPQNRRTADRIDQDQSYGTLSLDYTKVKHTQIFHPVSSSLSSTNTMTNTATTTTTTMTSPSFTTPKSRSNHFNHDHPPILTPLSTPTRNRLTPTSTKNDGEEENSMIEEKTSSFSTTTTTTPTINNTYTLQKQQLQEHLPSPLTTPSQSPQNSSNGFTNLTSNSIHDSAYASQSSIPLIPNLSPSIESQIPLQSSSFTTASLRPPVEAQTIAIELKPKWGFKPKPQNTKFSNMKSLAKHKYCRFCLHYLYKNKEKIKNKIMNLPLNHFCPLDLYSGNDVRIRKAINDLYNNPGNNLKIFINGKQFSFNDVNPTKAVTTTSTSPSKEIHSSTPITQPITNDTTIINNINNTTNTTYNLNNINNTTNTTYNLNNVKNTTNTTYNLNNVNNTNTKNNNNSYSANQNATPFHSQMNGINLSNLNTMTTSNSHANPINSNPSLNTNNFSFSNSSSSLRSLYHSHAYSHNHTHKKVNFSGKASQLKKKDHHRPTHLTHHHLLPSQNQDMAISNHPEEEEENYDSSYSSYSSCSSCSNHSHSYSHSHLTNHADSISSGDEDSGEEVKKRRLNDTTTSSSSSSTSLVDPSTDMIYTPSPLINTSNIPVNSNTIPTTNPTHTFISPHSRSTPSIQGLTTTTTTVSREPSKKKIKKGKKSLQKLADFLDCDCDNIKPAFCHFFSQLIIQESELFQKLKFHQRNLDSLDIEKIYQFYLYLVKKYSTPTTNTTTNTSNTTTTPISTTMATTTSISTTMTTTTTSAAPSIITNYLHPVNHTMMTPTSTLTTTNVMPPVLLNSSHLATPTTAMPTTTHIPHVLHPITTTSLPFNSPNSTTSSTSLINSPLTPPESCMDTMDSMKYKDEMLNSVIYKNNGLEEPTIEDWVNSLIKYTDRLRSTPMSSRYVSLIKKSSFKEKNNKNTMKSKNVLKSERHNSSNINNKNLINLTTNTNINTNSNTNTNTNTTLTTTNSNMTNNNSHTNSQNFKHSHSSPSYGYVDSHNKCNYPMNGKTKPNHKEDLTSTPKSELTKSIEDYTDEEKMQYILEFLISKTLKDCSILIAVQTENLPSNNSSLLLPTTTTTTSTNINSTNYSMAHSSGQEGKNSVMSYPNHLPLTNNSTTNRNNNTNTMNNNTTNNNNNQYSWEANAMVDNPDMETSSSSNSSTTPTCHTSNVNGNSEEEEFSFDKDKENYHEIIINKKKYRYNIHVVDLDSKSIKKIPQYYKLDQEIVNYYNIFEKTNTTYHTTECLDSDLF